MAIKKTKKRSKSSLKVPRKTSAGRKPKKRSSTKKLLPKKKPAAKKPLVKKKKKSTARNVTAKRSVTASKKKAARIRKPSLEREPGSEQSANVRSFAAGEVRARSGGQSGALQELSDSAGADSESVDELLEEGNAFEAGIVSGVEAADSEDEQEVHTREVREDDVPEEYLDKD